MAINSVSIEGLAVAQRFLQFSAAYLESARLLCARLLERPEEQNYGRACACMFNARFAVELFLKAALVERGATNGIHHHVIEDLAARYSELYPESR